MESLAQPETPTQQAPLLQPLPYQRAIAEYLEAQDADVWNWFASHRTRENDAEAMRLELLKAAYRISREDQPPLYALADTAAEKLQLDVPVTIYQSQSGEAANAWLAYLPGAAHVVLSGPIQSKLSEQELQAILGHELAHFLLFDGWDQRYFIARQMLDAMTRDDAADAAHRNTARQFSLNAEIFCDRGGLLASGNLDATITALIKMETGAEQVSAASYLEQADEIFAGGNATTQGWTHPETYIRAKALKLWADDAEQADLAIDEMLSGPLALEKLDLLGQHKVAQLTRRLIDTLIAPAWFQTDAVLAQARSYFHDFIRDELKPDDTTLAVDIATPDEKLQDYYCFVLLDFVTVDRDLTESALAAAVAQARRLGLIDRFRPLAIKELRLGKRQFEQIEAEAEK